MDRNFNEMTETEATLENQLDNLDFMVYQLTTGSIFTADEPRDQATIDKINKLTGKASDQLISAMETLIELKSIINNSVEVLPDDKEFMELSYKEMLKEVSENPERFLHEVDCAESAEILVNSKILNVSDIKFDGEEAVLIELETVDGQRICMIKTDESLLCSGWKEV
ncbi:MAG: hypothetical protein ACLRNU_03330 [Lachnospiraceae bacterium]|uniref:Uncharacterized protein n=1 Tax=[Ruminococcus] torques TaxID=33039 RepID=A0A6N2YZW9_9FIRM